MNKIFDPVFDNIKHTHKSLSSFQKFKKTITFLITLPRFFASMPQFFAQKSQPHRAGLSSHHIHDAFIYLQHNPYMRNLPYPYQTGSDHLLSYLPASAILHQYPDHSTSDHLHHLDDRNRLLCSRTLRDRRER